MKRRYTVTRDGATGVALVLSTVYAGLFEVDLIQVEPKSKRGQGIGTELLNQITEDADAEGLILKLVCVADREHQAGTMRLYERFGFRIVGYAGSCPVMERAAKAVA